MFEEDARESLESKITLPVGTHRKKTILQGPMNSLACPRINWASVAHEWPERVADVMPDDEIGHLVLLGGFVIDNNELRARAFCHQRKTRRRPDHQRRAD